MKISPLNSILKSFSDNELVRFGEFISSPYFNKALYVKNYYEKIRELSPDFENLDEAKKEVFESLYPERIYNDSTIRKLNSELLKLVEEFIITDCLKERIYLRNNLLLEELDKRKADNLFIKKLNSSYRILEESSIKNEKYFRELHNLNNIELFFYSIRDRKKELSRYKESIENLDKFYIIQKLKKLTIVARVNKMYAIFKADKKEINNFVKWIKRNQFFNFPIIQILFNVLMINQTDENEYFKNLRKQITLYKKEISRKELESVYIAMINYCVTQANMGNSEFDKDELQIYKNMIEDNFLLINNRIQATFYKNIVFCAVNAGDLNFAIQFKDEYGKYIYSEDKNDTIEFCNANIAFAKKEYDKALEILAKINFSIVGQRFSLRGLYFKIFYENEMYEQALLNIDSYKQILKREKTLPEDILKLYKNFVGLYSKLLKIKLSQEKGEAKLLLKSIKKTDTIGKNWLIEKCIQLC